MNFERIHISCDVSNLWKSCREKFGPDARLDFQILSNVLRALRHPVLIQQQLVAYIVTHYGQNPKDFISKLKYLGFEVRERYMSYVKGVSRPLHTDWDVGITIDAIDRMDSYDTFALLSGDGDFVQLLEYLKRKGKKTLVMSFEHALSKHLTDTADEVIPLTETVVYQRQ